jgi:protein-disulfide isomerase
MKKFSLLALSPLAALILLTSCNASDKQIEEWVKNNPEKILEAIVEHQKKEQEKNRPSPDMVKQNSSELFSESSPSVGSGPIKIAYFYDFNCGHCSKQSDTIKNVIAKTDNKVTVYYKNFAVLGPASELAAKAALAAHQQKKFKEFYEEVYKTKDKSMNSLRDIAKKLKLDVKKWEKDMEGSAVSEELQRTRQLAGKMKIRGTPFLAIAPDKVFPGRVDQLLEIVQSM